MALPLCVTAAYTLPGSQRQPSEAPAFSPPKPTGEGGISPPMILQNEIILLLIKDLGGLSSSGPPVRARLCKPPPNLSLVR